METSLELSRWRDLPRGVGYRRGVIISSGIRSLLRTRFFKILTAVAWVGGAAIAAFAFAFSQSVADGGWMETLARNLPPHFRAVTAALGGFIALYPDIVVGGLFTLVFWLHSFLGLGLSLIALIVVVPKLITQDRATNALTAYLSRPLTSVDYLLGKLGTITGVLALVWTGPLLFGWLLSMVFAPNRDFIHYSLSPLMHALAFNGIGLVALAAIALGVSALSRSSRNTIIIWVGLWLVAGTLAKPPGAPDTIRRASFTHSLGEVRQEVFRLDTAFLNAAEDLPFLDPQFADSLRKAGEKARTDDFNGSLASLALFIGASSLIFFRRLRAE